MQIGQIANTQNSLMQLAQNQQAMQARAGIGQAYQAAIDPTTGQLDTNKLMQAASSDPRVAWMAGDLASQALARQKAQFEIVNAGLDASGKQQTQEIGRQGYIQGLLGGAMAASITDPDKIHSMMDKAVSDGIISPNEEAHWRAQIPEDPKQMMGFLQAANAQNASAQERYGMSQGTPISLNQGGTMLYGRQLPAGQGGGAQFNSAVTMGLSPGEATAPTTIGIDLATGAPITGTRGQFLQATQPNPFGAGRFPRPGQPGPPAQVPGIGGVQTAPGPGQQIALATPARVAQDAALGQVNVANQGMGQDLQAANTAANTMLAQAGQPSQQRQAALGEMLDLTNQFSPGKGGQTIAGLRNIGQRFGFDLGSDQLSAQETFNKLAAQLSMAQGATGSGSDQWLNQAMAANPHGDLSKQGLQRIIPLLQGSEDALQATSQAFLAAKAQNPSVNYFQWRQQNAGALDPRVYQFERMSPAQQAAQVAGMQAADASSPQGASPQGLAVFRQHYNQAAGMGLLTTQQSAQVAAPQPSPASAAPAPVMPTPDVAHGGQLNPSAATIVAPQVSIPELSTGP